MKFPLTMGQQGLWYLAQANEAANVAFNVVMCLEVQGTLCTDMLRQAWRSVCARHLLLQSRVEVCDFEASFVAGPSVPQPDVETCVASSLETAAAPVARQALNLESGPLHRLLVVRSGEGVAIGLVLVVHHLITDGLSMSVILDELCEAYAPTATGHRGDPSRPADLVTRQQQLVARERASLAQSQTQARIAALAGDLVIASDRSRFALGSPADGGAPYPASVVSTEIGGELLAGLRALAATEGCTTAAIFLAASQLMIGGISGATSLVFSVPTNWRDEEDLTRVGYFMNLGLVRGDVDRQQTVRQMIECASDGLYQLMDDRHIPYPSVVRAAKAGDVAEAALEPIVGFNYQRAARRRWRMGGCELHPRSSPVVFSKDPIDIDIEEWDDRATCWISFDREALPGATAQRMVGEFTAWLSAFVARPEAVIASMDEPARVMGEALRLRCRQAAEAEQGGTPDVLDMFDAWARQAPAAPAVAGAGTNWSYAQLAALSGQVARSVLQACGPDEPVAPVVAVCVEDSALAIPALLGVLRAGATYLPLDPALPDERLQRMLALSKASLVLTGHGLQARFDGHPVRCLPIEREVPVVPHGLAEFPAGEARAAYCLFTSGSTGEPKAVLVGRRALGMHVCACVQAYGIVPADKVLQFASPGVDPSIEQMLVSLCAGACVCPKPVGGLAPAGLPAYLRDHAVTVADLPTALWHLYAAEGLDGLRETPLRLVIIGGEAASAGSVRDRKWPWTLINAYGPTEATVTATLATIGESAIESDYLPIGDPVAGLCALVLDAALRPVPAGVAGDLYLAGGKLAEGYLGRPDLTAERFIPNPFGPPGSRMYRTGDVVKESAAQGLLFLGREDDQVKIRGFRVEPGEIEAALLADPAIERAVVLGERNEAGEMSLAAYLVGAAIDLPSVRQRLAQTLPNHLIPVRWARLQSLPMGPGGKLDRAALAGVRTEPLHGDGPAGEAPQEGLERLIAGTWAAALHVPAVGRHDNFFALGGHSLLATQIVARLREALQREVSIRHLLDAPSVAELAHLLQQSPQEAAAPARPKLVRRANASAMQ